MHIARGRLAQRGSDHRVDDTKYAGGVWIDWVFDLREPQLRVTYAFFHPGHKSVWHSHTKGQLCVAVAGRGQIGTRSERVHGMQAGDVVYFAPGEEHFQGADTFSSFLQLTVTFGKNLYFEPVSDDASISDEPRP